MSSRQKAHLYKLAARRAICIEEQLPSPSESEIQRVLRCDDDTFGSFPGPHFCHDKFGSERGTGVLELSGLNLFQTSSLLA